MNQSNSGNFSKRHRTAHWQEHQDHRNQMIEYRDRISAEFSTFWLPPSDPKTTAWVAKKVVDPRLEQVLISLIADDLSVGHDAWARYFLLTLREKRSSQENKAEEGFAFTQLRQLEIKIQAAIQEASNYNSPVLPIHRHIQARCQEAAIDRFLKQADLQTKKLLTAYFQRTCWYTANRFFADKEECFQIAVAATSDPEKLLQKFELSRTVQIRTYVEGKLRGIVSDFIKAGDIERKTESLKDDGLLRSVSRKELLEALRNQKSDRELACYELIFHIYKEVYQRQKIQQGVLKPPTFEELEQMAICFNQRRSALKISMTATQDLIRAKLQEMVQSIRNYRSKTAFHQRIFDYNSQLEDESPLDAIAQEEAKSQIQEAVQRSFLQLPFEIQQLLIIRSVLGLTQIESSAVMNNLIQQSQISRKETKCKKDFLNHLISELRLLYPELFADRTAIDEQIDEIQKTIVPQFLQRVCEQSFHAILQTQLKRLRQENRLSLTSFFYSGADQNLSELGQQLNALIEEAMQIQFSQCESAHRKLIDYVTAWLSNP